MSVKGRVVQINISPGGVPKLPVAAARVTPDGLEGDGHRDLEHHGGPERALCLFSLEQIRALQAEGHAVTPGAHAFIDPNLPAGYGPFNVAAIGPQNALLGAFDDPNQLQDIKQRRDVQGLGFRVTRASAVHVPAYSGALNVRYAQPH